MVLKSRWTLSKQATLCSRWGGLPQVETNVLHSKDVPSSASLSEAQASFPGQRRRELPFLKSRWALSLLWPIE